MRGGALHAPNQENICRGALHAPLFFVLATCSCRSHAFCSFVANWNYLVGLVFPMSKRFSKTALACALVAVSFAFGVLYAFCPNLPQRAWPVVCRVFAPPVNLIKDIAYESDQFVRTSVLGTLRYLNKQLEDACADHEYQVRHKFEQAKAR